RTAVAAAASLVLLAVFAAIAVSVVNGRRPLERKLTQSFGVAASHAAGSSATVFAPACRKTSVEFYDCTAVVTPRGHGRVVNVNYKVWLTGDGCWGTSIRTRGLQPAALGPVRRRFTALHGCVVR